MSHLGTNELEVNGAGSINQQSSTHHTEHQNSVNQWSGFSINTLSVENNSNTRDSIYTKIRGLLDQHSISSQIKKTTTGFNLLFISPGIMNAAIGHLNANGFASLIRVDNSSTAEKVHQRYLLIGIHRSMFGEISFDRLINVLSAKLAEALRIELVNVKVLRLCGDNAIVTIHGESIVAFIGERLIIDIEMRILELIIYKSFNVCRNCGGFRCGRTCANSPICIKCSSRDHVITSCSNSNRFKCFRCISNPDYRHIAAKHMADNPVCPSIQKLAVNQPATIYNLESNKKKSDQPADQTSMN